MVHNLRNTSDTEEATMLFSRQVMQCYDGELSHLGRLIFTADLGEGVPPVHHIGLCYEFSKAGDAFNAKNREHLLQRCLGTGGGGDHRVLMGRSSIRWIFTSIHEFTRFGKTTTTCSKDCLPINIAGQFFWCLLLILCITGISGVGSICSMLTPGFHTTRQ